MSLEITYWSNVLKKIDEKTAKMRIESIYNSFCEQNAEKIKNDIKQAEARRRAKQEGTKDYQTPFTALKIDNINKGVVEEQTQSIEKSEI